MAPASWSFVRGFCTCTRPDASHYGAEPAEYCGPTEKALCRFDLARRLPLRLSANLWCTSSSEDGSEGCERPEWNVSVLSVAHVSKSHQHSYRALSGAPRHRCE